MIEGKGSTGDGRRLDGLQMGRGLAATIVVVDHAILHNFRTPPGFVPLLGVYGVTLFFLISGFIMVRVSGESSFAPGRFLLNRFQRVAPLYYVACALLAVQVLIVPWAFKTTHLEFWHVLRSLLFIPAYSPTAGPGFITPFYQLGWTLNFEMFFYVVFASLFFLRSAQRVCVLTVLFAGLMIAGQTVHFDQAIPSFYTRIDLASFLVGAWFGLCSQRGGMVIGRRTALALFALSLVLIGYVMLHPDHYSEHLPLRLAMLAGATMHIAIIIGYFDRLRKAIPRFLLRLGDASYAIYLFHMFAIGPIAFVGKKLGPDFLIPAIVLSLIGGVFAGLVAHRCFERPIAEWIKRRRRTEAQSVIPVAGQEADAILPAAGREATLQ